MNLVSVLSADVVVSWASETCVTYASPAETIYAPEFCGLTGSGSAAGLEQQGGFCGWNASPQLGLGLSPPALYLRLVLVGAGV